MAEQSLEELKAENAKSEDETKVTDEPEQLIEDPKDDPVQDVEVEDEGEAAEEVEAWMQTEEANSDDDHKGGFKPNPEAAAVRKKLRGKLKEKDQELEVLQQRIAELESQKAPEQQQKVQQLAPRPKLEDFDYDQDAWAAAFEKWTDDKVAHQFSSSYEERQKQQQQQQQQQAAKQAMDSAVNDHYARAQTLVDEGKVTEDSYRNADHNVRSAMEQSFKGQGDYYTDALIATLNSIGEGSEKVMYMLGSNPVKLGRLQELMRNDPSGLQASAYLGSLQSQALTPVKRQSVAPKPGSKVDGDVPAKGPADAMMKRYKRAGDDVQKRIDIKREAKKAGIDTSHW